MLGKQGKRLNDVKGSKAKKWAIVTLAGVIWIAPVLGAGQQVWSGSSWQSVAAAASTTTNKLSEEILTSGAKLMKYNYTTTRSGSKVNVLADVIQVDLQNPYVKLDVMTGKGGNLNSKQSTGGMAKENGAVAAVNGDYFNVSGELAPIGGQVSDGVLVSTPSELSGMYALTVTKDGKPMIDEYSFDGTVKADDGSTFALRGINKEDYTVESSSVKYSHANSMYIYTPAWTSTKRPNDPSTTPTEVLVQNGVITQISDKKALNMTVPADGYILRAHGTAATWIMTHLAVGQTLNADYKLKAKTTGETVDPSNLQMMIGGHTILVNDGKAATFSRDIAASGIGGIRARTAVGYSQDGRYVYIIAAEKNSNSSGLSLTELQSFMTSIGVWKGMNLDGGGSTTMVTRPLGEETAGLTFNTEYGTEQRQVVNTLGVFSTAPEGKLQGFAVSGSQTLLVGQEGKYTAKGYDTYYNPIATGDIKMTWKSSNNGIVSVSNGTIKGVKPGTVTLTATSNGASSSIKVTVLGGSELASLTAGSGLGSLQAGTTISIPVTAKTKDGQSLTVPADSLTWEFIGFKGKVSADQLTVSSVNAGAQVGYAIGRYDGYSTVVVLSAAASETIWENFENVSYPINFTTNASGVTGSASVTAGTGEKAGSKVLQLSYDMTAGIGKMYAYAQLNGSTGKEVSATATSMSMDVMGDKSLNWLRAEFTDASGKTVYADLAKAIDWDGWKKLNVDLNGLNISYPAKLKRVYVVNVEEGQDERAKTGTVAFDNIAFTMPSKSSEVGLPTGTASLVLGQKSMTVNGTKKAIDSAPVLKNGTTYVPIKHVLDAFGGQASWDSKNQRVTVVRGGKLIDLVVGQKEFIINGKRQSATVAPYVSGGRTLVPLRLVSEQLGLTVKWEQNTKTVTISS
ncbi:MULTISPECIES: stalk domain-containing protein [unclassified Paenibacillus]|uniref:stalk domain-containing protein n=1 Tax=unclassified Paenibacillus TaxID=185978 RepID=UPI0009A7BB3B|nr:MULTISPECIES: stalk domain-containing protein [unclassified Paenibacillus]SLK06960.1 Ig-like domain (group 2) [Paenibacillus sp. RU5A]SOC70691.1 Ig-like domain (group 2) [Paenibacillus sp. RU26A]SOC72848.1 Ig-like domain (group 2) [Paenibacillus sp. RU5M]